MSWNACFVIKFGCVDESRRDGDRAPKFERRGNVRDCLGLGQPQETGRGRRGGGARGREETRDQGTDTARKQCQSCLKIVDLQNRGWFTEIESQSLCVRLCILSSCSSPVLLYKCADRDHDCTACRTHSLTFNRPSAHRQLCVCPT